MQFHLVNIDLGGEMEIYSHATLMFYCTVYKGVTHSVGGIIVRWNDK